MRGVTLVSCLLVALCASIAAAAGSTTAPGNPLAGPACGQLTTRTLAATDGMVAERIYRDELAGPATVVDSHQVESYGPLLSALEEKNRPAIREAVIALVFSHTHIVRLRVSQTGTLLSDVGGRYIIAPVGGDLYYHAHLVGSYLFSVQDDLGFVGLEKRLVGVPLVLHVNGKRVPVQGTMRNANLAIPRRGTIVIGKRSFEAYSFNAKAYPTGTLRISLLHPADHPSTRSCAAVKLAETGRVTRAIWERFKLDGSPITGFVTFAHSHTGALTFVRRGSQQIASSTQPGPRSIPKSGVLRYHGVRYAVTSFSSSIAAGSVRVYTLAAI